jgi:myosin heavy subunit
MKTKDLPIFKQKILDMLPVKQVDMWRKLEIDSREGSYIVDIMLKENLLTRRRLDKSFLLEKLNGNGNGNIYDTNEEADAKLKKKNEEADAKLKKKNEEADAKLKKRNEDADAKLKKKNEEADAKLKKKKEEADAKLKKKKEEADAKLKKKKEDSDLKKKVKEDSDLKKKVKEDSDLKKKVKEDSDLKKKVKEDSDLKKDTDFVAKTCDKNIQNVKKEDITVLKQRVLDILPILQADIWKRLDACDCNYLELVDIMVRENTIRRTKYGKAFLLEVVNDDKRKHGTKTDVSTILSDMLIQKQKPKDPNDLRRIILSKLPIAPSDLLESLDVSNRVCSTTINEMIKENILTRTEKNGRFLLEKARKNTKKIDINYEALLSRKSRFAPCCGCALECDAEKCMLLDEWLLE